MVAKDWQMATIAMMIRVFARIPATSVHCSVPKGIGFSQKRIPIVVRIDVQIRVA